MLTLKLSYVLELTPQQFRIISAALRGELKPEWQEEAKELQNQLFHERLQQAQNDLGNITKASKSVPSSHNPTNEFTIREYRS